MPRAAVKARYVREFLLRELKSIYERKRDKYIKLETLPSFPTKKSLIDYVFENGPFIDLEKEPKGDPSLRRAPVSRNTVGNVINAMIDDGVIGKEDGEYILLPSYSEREKDYPIIQIASQIDIKVLKPESMFFLEVPQNTAGMIADYINAQFYLGDIKAIPFGNVIMCMGILPESAIKHGHFKDPNAELFVSQMLLDVLKDFNITYPDFKYKTAYKMGYMIQNNATLRESLRETAREAATTLDGFDKTEYERLCKQFFVDIPLFSDTIGRGISFDSSPHLLLKKSEDDDN